jgi:hypothetical protein
MKRTVISYQVRPETAAVNEELIRGVFNELAQNPIPALTSFKR